ncbi:flagellar hook assembly protein FlgD [Thalassospira marina]|uniref:Basal-body rod modification protein FlgD n=1 Tax=Thalassospira marina TaxID=2048283 RepID=A0A2N3KSQ7_9PROT|nr:flagellar hook capping FlgD N-terminal domain-containing protein [Thalassospira marina]PKR53557.1 flagellar biosynthesis protein FlgD [Thalassospira marina]
MSFLSGLTTSTLSAATSSATTSSSTSSTSSSSASSAASSTYDTYMTLLLTQLQNQNPTDPEDTSEITTQLATFEQLNLAEQNNSLLTDLSSSLQSLQGVVENSAAQSYLGTDIVALGDSAPLEDGEAEWYFVLDDDAASVNLKVTDDDGNVVYQTTTTGNEGSNNFVWDGTQSDGTVATSGVYTLSVTATDSSGNAIDSQTLMTGVVSALDLTGDDAVLYVNGVDVDLDDVQGAQTVS